ncbi:MAG: right-handed parallel beta-helix repeat-containing protein, partial [Candidatus Woesearchaeota archaeon]
MNKFISCSLLISLIFFFYIDVFAAEYYLDADNGNDDSGDGSSGNPWRTIEKAQQVMQSGDVFYLRNGNYNTFSENSASGRSDWITFQAESGHDPFVTGIYLLYDSQINSYLRFENIDVLVPYYRPTCDSIPSCVLPDGYCDPQCPDIGVGHYISVSDAIRIENARNVEFSHGNIIGSDKYLTGGGVGIYDSENILFFENEMTKVFRGVEFEGNKNIILEGNHIHEGVGSCIRLLPVNEGVTIERNHCHDFGYDFSDDYCPRGSGNNPHGSALSIRTGDIVISNNIFHDGFNSAGVMFYELDSGQPEDTHYSNVLFENNIVYDVVNTYAFRAYRLGDNITFRNNLLVGHYRTNDQGDITPDGRYRYQTAFQIHSFADGFDGSGFSMYNNIVIGIASMGESNPISEDNNIIWSYLSGDWQCSPPRGQNTKIITCSYSNHDNYFENDFFQENINFYQGHENTYAFEYDILSEAYNFGDSNNQPGDSLGTLDPDGFILDNGNMRDSSHHSAGPYEFSGADSESCVGQCTN